MALLQDIRKRSWLLILGIGLPLFAFIVGDAFSQGSIFGDPNELGSAGGTPINIQDYNLAYNRLSRNPQMQEASENMISEMAWNQLISERLVAGQLEDLGIKIDENKFYEEAGRFYSSVNPNLMDENGRINIELTKTFVSELKTAAQMGNPQAQNWYEQWENANPQFRLQSNLYSDLVSVGALATDVEAAFNQRASAPHSIEYVMINYEEFVKNNPVEVTDNDIIGYMKDRPKTFKAEPSVNLAYAYFPGDASQEDINLVSNELNSYLSQHIIRDEATGISDTIRAFAAAVNDSAYVSRFSESPFDPTYYTRDQFQSFPEELKTPLLNANKGDVIGPIKLNNVYNLIKVSDVRSITDSAKTSHILIGYQGSSARADNITRTYEEAMVYADSILNEVKANPAKFNELARTVSDDAVAANSNGDIGWVGRFQQGFATSYRDWAVNNPKGSIDLVPSEFGFHIIRIDDVKQVTGYQLATIQKQVRASQDTQENLFNKANTLAINSQGKTANDFINDARKEGAEVNNADGIKRFESNLVGLQGTRKEAEILKWAFEKDTKAGSVQTFETVNGGQIAVYLSNKYDRKTPNVAAARASVEPMVRNQKIADKIASETQGADLDAVASKYNATKQTASINYNSPMIDGAGVEPKLGGAIMGLGEGKTSGAIKGNTGVYFVKVVQKGAAPEGADTTGIKNNISLQIKNQIKNGVVQSLVDAANVKDNRIEKLR
ncbi:MAG: peptidylprolyl isomerase [Flavobacteriaceae bacterium]|nr:peptidylprolyl isomerase [Flavobacteriaceae bacterium]